MPCIVCSLRVHGGEYAGVRLMLVACSGTYVSVTSATRDKTVYVYFEVYVYTDRVMAWSYSMRNPTVVFVHPTQESQIMACQLVCRWMKSTFQ